MDATLLTSPRFWEDSAPCAGGLPPDAAACITGRPDLAGHVWFSTSGTTGRPKWVALSKEALLASAEVVNTHLRVDSASCWGLALPLRHVGGFGVVARAFLAGCRLEEFPSRWDAMEFGRWLEERHVTHGSLVPTQVHDLVAAGVRAPRSLQAVVVGGGHLPESTGRAARDLGWPVLASYGMTETASQIATQPLSALELVYQPAPIPLLPSWRVELGDDRCLRVCGKALYSGILADDGTGWEYVPRAGEWHRTRDRVAIGPGGLVPLGRADGFVKVLGELVDPAEIERGIYRIAAGRLRPNALVVVAVPDARSGHALVPVIDTSADPDPVDEWLEIYQKNAPGLFRLRGAVRLDGFPQGALGKPSRSAITDMVDAGIRGGKVGI